MSIDRSRKVIDSRFVPALLVAAMVAVGFAPFLFSSDLPQLPPRFPPREQTPPLGGSFCGRLSWQPVSLIVVLQFSPTYLPTLAIALYSLSNRPRYLDLCLSVIQRGAAPCEGRIDDRETFANARGFSLHRAARGELRPCRGIAAATKCAERDCLAIARASCRHVAPSIGGLPGRRMVKAVTRPAGETSRQE